MSKPIPTLILDPQSVAPVRSEISRFSAAQIIRSARRKGRRMVISMPRAGIYDLPTCEIYTK